MVNPVAGSREVEKMLAPYHLEEAMINGCGVRFLVGRRRTPRTRLARITAPDRRVCTILPARGIPRPAY
jgi:hypothetical protein